MINSAQVLDLVNSGLTQVSTSIPAIVLRYNSTKQVIDVELAVKRPYNDDTSLDEPIRLFNVPVLFPQGSNWVMAGPLIKGDAVVLHFPMFDCDNWFNGDKNRVYEANSKYYHDIDGAFATIGAFTYNSPTRDSRFRDKFHIVQGDNYLTMESGKVVIESTSGASKITMQGGQVTVEASHVQVNANTSISGNLDVTGTITAPNMTATTSLSVDGQHMENHTHTEQCDGNETSGPNNNGV